MIMKDFKHCIVVGAGELFGRKIDIRKADLIIAADGGYKYLKSQSIKPDIIIGDMDSINVEAEGTEKIILPGEKNDTDTLYAVKYALDKGFKKFSFYGCTGGRSEHTFANYQILNYLADKNCSGYIFGDKEKITIIKNDTLVLEKKLKGRVSAFAMSEMVHVTLKNLKYTLDDYLMNNKFPIGVSNEFIEGKSAEIKAENGSLLVFIDDNY